MLLKNKSHLNKFIIKKNNTKRSFLTGKRLYRSIGKHGYRYYYYLDTNRLWNNQLALVVGFLNNWLKYNKSIFIIKYANNSYSLIHAIYGLFLGDYVKSIFLSTRYYFQSFLGYRIPLLKVSKYFIISQVENVYKNKPIYSKSEGTFCSIVDLNHDLKICLIQLPSKRRKYFSLYCFVTIGRNANLLKKYSVIGKAGFNRQLGKSSIVRGVAMNPVDHPHGGRTKTNKPEVSLWGNIAKHSH